MSEDGAGKTEQQGSKLDKSRLLMLSNAFRQGASPETIKQLEKDLRDKIGNRSLRKLQKDAERRQKFVMERIAECLKDGPKFSDAGLANKIAILPQENPYSEDTLKKIYAALGISPETVNENIMPDKYVRSGQVSDTTIATPHGFSINVYRDAGGDDVPYNFYDTEVIVVKAVPSANSHQGSDAKLPAN